MDAWRLAAAALAVAALALAAFAPWQPALVVATGDVAGPGFIDINSSQFFNYSTIAALAAAQGSAENAYFDVLMGIVAVRVRKANDTIVWMVLNVMESTCRTSMAVFDADNCTQDYSKPLRECAAAVYIGELGVHKSTQYYKCKPVNKKGKRWNTLFKQRETHGAFVDMHSC